MEQERYVVYEYTYWPNETQDAWEVSWHKTLEKAREVATAAHSQPGLPYRLDIDWVEWDGTAWNNTWSEADAYAVGFPNPAHRHTIS